MNDASTILMSPDLQFSYSQFFVYDAGKENPACSWTEAHTSQGFARREGVVAVGTLLEFGRAQVSLVLGKPVLEQFERAVAVPLEITSGEVAVDGPEEEPGIRKQQLKSGHYRAVVAQRKIDESTEQINIWLEEVALPLENSELLVVDDALNPAGMLLETASKP